MKTECTLNTSGFRFTVTEKKGNEYSLQIERETPWGETVIAYGTLKRPAIVVKDADEWILDAMTFEDAHQECVLADFFIELYRVKHAAYPEAVKYYEANRQPDIFEAIDNYLANRKAI